MTDPVQEAIERLLPLFHKAWAASQIPPGRCPASTPYFAISDEDDSHLWCDLRAGHIGDHETDKSAYGPARWKNDTPPPVPYIPPGPCPHTTSVKPASSNGPQTLYALCDLRAGHDGQHEATSDEHGYYRWSDPSPRPKAYTDAYPQLADRCGHQRPGPPGVVCWKHPGHANAHTNGAFLWNDCGEDVQIGV